MLAAKKANFEKIFDSNAIEKMEPLHLRTGKLQNRDVIQLEYMIVLKSQKKLAAHFLFTDDNGVTKILNTNFFEGDQLNESNSFTNTSWNLSSVLLVLGFLTAFLLIVTAASKVIKDKPQMWGLWLVLILMLGFTVIKGNWTSGEWNYQLIHLAFGFPLISYSKNEFSPLFLEFCIPVVAILYLAIREKLIVSPEIPPDGPSK